MAIKTFDNIDLADITVVSPPVDDLSTVGNVPPSFIRTGFIASFSNSLPNPGGNDAFSIQNVIITALIDLAAFPSIPDGSVITKVRIIASSSYSFSLAASNADGPYSACSVGTYPSPNYLTIGFGNDSFTLQNLHKAAIPSPPPYSAGYTSALNLSGNGVSTELVLPGGTTKEDFLNLYGVDYPASQNVLMTMTMPHDLRASSAAGGTVSAAASYNFDIADWRIEFEYDSTSYSWTLSVPDEPVSPGNLITVTSPDENGIDFTELLTVDVVLPSGTIISVPFGDWVIVGPNLFVFIMPDFGGEEPTVVTIVITSTQFSGSVTLGTLITIYFLSATGIYRLVMNKRSDTLYIEEDPGETIDVKIPNPFAKTGFIGG